MSCPIITEESLYIAIRDNKVFQDIIFFFCVICFLGSSLVLISLYKSRPLPPHLLLVASLSFADLVLCCESALFVIYFNKQPDLVKSCQIDAFFSTFGVLLSLMSFGMITIERYLVICQGLQNHAKKTIISIAIAFVYSILTSLLISLSPEHVDLAGGMLCRPSFCSQTMTMLIINSSFVIVVLGFLASVIYCPYKILQIYSNTITAVDSIHQAENRQAINDRRIKERKVFIKLSIITGVFVVMVGPLAIALVYEIITKRLGPNPLIYIFMLGLGSNSAFNPLLLYVFDIGVKTRIDAFLGLSSNTRRGTSPTLPSKITRLKYITSNVKVTVNSDVKDTVKIVADSNVSRYN